MKAQDASFDRPKPFKQLRMFLKIQINTGLTPVQQLHVRLFHALIFSNFPLGDYLAF